MATLNKVTLIGYLGRDPDRRTTAAGDAVVNFTLATHEAWKDKATGEKKEATEWHRVVLYRKLAEIAGEYLKKGSLVYVEGRLHSRKWIDKDENERVTVEIVADDLRMLGAKPAVHEGAGDEEQQAKEPEGRAATPVNASRTPRYDFEDENIPF